MEERLKRPESQMASAAASGSAPGRRRRLRLVPLLLILVVLTSAASLAIYYWQTKHLPFELQRFLERPAVEQVIPLDSFLVNLKDERATHYIKTSMTLTYLNKKDKAVIEQQMPQIRDVVIQFLRGLSRTEIMAANTLEMYRRDLLEQINLIFTDDPVYNLYFTDFLIQ